VRLELEEELGQRAASQVLLPGHESGTEAAASLLTDPPLPEHERLVLEQLRHDESLQLDELIEKLDTKLGSAEIFTALFELELGGRIKQLPGKNYVRSF
jgi:DNA processing protein